MYCYADLEAQGFTVEHDDDAVRVSCDQCAAAVINGLACHERGCPNERKECKGCNESVPMNVDYCADCR